MKVDILGEKYEVIAIKKENPRYNHCDGYCDETIKAIGVKEYAQEGDILDKGDLGKQQRKVLRHEIIHAFLFESGLAENSEWAQIEEMVDFFAIQFPKLVKAFEEAKAI